MSRPMSTRELLQTIRDRGAVLFGAGFVAKTFFRVLSEEGLGERVRACVVSGAPEGPFFGRSVYSLEAYAAARRAGDPATEGLLCLAVHETVRPAVEQALAAAGLDEYVWIYPNCRELLWGPAIQEDVRIPLRDLLKAQEEDQYWITVRYGAMKEWLAGEENGPATQTYRKAAGLFSGQDTALRRLAAARELAAAMEKDGFDGRCPIWIDTRYRVIDGLHRLAAAALAGVETVPCRIFAAGERFSRYLTEDNRLTAAAQQRAGLTREERRYLQETRSALTKGLGGAEKPEISVILPVYNVEEYMDQCLRSVTGQSMGRIEILLINDGSTDGSLAKCLEWERRDPRITVLDRANGGVASARNLGIEMARGEYLAFVDPDDWLEETYLEKLLRAAREADADYAECDLWRYDNRSGKKIYRSCYGRMGRAYTLREHMKYGPTATYKAISRRSLWVDNGVRMPSCSFESPAVYSLLLALSNRVVNVREALYYYRRFRENSLIENGYAHKDGKSNNTLGVEAMAFLEREYRRTGLYQRYADTLEGIVKYRLSDILATQFHRKREEDFRELVRNYRRFLSETFPRGHNEPYVTWGGYNLNRILTHMTWLHDPSARFNFSSVISLSGRGTAPGAAAHKNRYRQMMLQRELDRQLWDVLRECRPEYLFLDLLEERFDILELGERFLTISDAFEGGRFGEQTPAELLAAGRVIPRDSRECTQLWQESFRRMAEEVRRLRPGIRFVVVESYLCETVGDPEHREPFPERDRIGRINEILRGYYRYVKELLPEAAVVSPAEDDLYFTDSLYEYGAIPSHLNEIENQRIAERIEEVLCQTNG